MSFRSSVLVRSSRRNRPRPVSRRLPARIPNGDLIAGINSLASAAHFFPKISVHFRLIELIARRRAILDATITHAYRTHLYRRP